MTSRLVSPVFAGREAELALMASALNDAAGGLPRLVVLGAEAGGGKSRLVGEFTAWLADRALVLAGGCVEFSAAGLPYAPFTTVLRQLVRERGAAAVAALLSGQDTGELAGLLPDFGRPPTGIDPDLARARLFELLLALLEVLADRRPLVLVMEDMHWADRSTLDLLSFLVRNLRHAAVLAVVTFRSDELHRTHPLRALLAELGRMDAVTRLELPRLSRDQVAIQLEGILGRAPDPAVTAAVFERGGGVPLFTEALLNADGTVSTGLPWSLRDLLLGTVKELPEQTQQVLRTAAAGGTRVGHRLLAAVTVLDGAGLAAALRPAVSANVVVADAAGYAFRHELIREAVREDLLPSERAEAERAFAEALQADPALSGDGMVAVELALHWRGADEPERALRAAWDAAGSAAVGLAFAERLLMLEQVLELWDQVPAAAEHTGTDHAGVARLAADAARWAGEPQRGLSLIDVALRELGGAGDAQRCAGLLLQRAILSKQQLLPDVLDDLRAALRLARGATPLRAQILAQLARQLWVEERDEEARQATEEMLALADRLGDREGQIEALLARHHLGERRARDTVSTMREARESARQIGSARLEVRAYGGITHVLEGRGDHELAIREGRDGMARARQLGLARYAAMPIAPNLAESLISAGRWDEAVEVLEDALNLDPTPRARASLLLQQGQIAVARGEQDTAAQVMRQLRQLAAGAEAETQLALPVARLTTEYELARGEVAGALVAVRAALARYSGTGPRYLWPLVGTGMRACAEAGPVRLAHNAGPAELRSALQLAAADLPRDGRMERAHGAVFDAETTRAVGQPDLAAWDAAADAWESLSQPYPLAYALLHGAGNAAAGDRAAAATRLQRAAELAGQLRARPLLQQISRLARRARIEIESPAGAPATAAVPFGLTERELEVLRLVAAGHGNREIAAELFISPKTASVHVSNILGKLGAASRGEAAATAHRLHIFDPP